MSRQTIPEQHIVNCDCCGRSMIDSPDVAAPWKMKTYVTWKCHALDRYGDPAADGSRTFDFCDHCATAIRGAMEQKIMDIRAGLKT